MRSPAMAIEAWEWMRRAPNSLPRSGPDPTGVTAAARSWINSVTSTIRAVFRSCMLYRDVGDVHPGHPSILDRFVDIRFRAGGGRCLVVRGDRAPRCEGL